MNIEQIETNLQKLIKSFSKETFIYDLLLAYDLPKASITRLMKGNLNLSKVQGEISWKKKLFFKEELKADLHLTISKFANELKHNQRFIVVTDYETLLSIDTKTDDKLDIALTDIPKHYDFFLPWAGMEKAQHQNENPADIKAAEKMAKLFDEIKKDNPDDSPEFIHGLNVFLSRLLFCFFAEDTHIFEDNQFTNAIDSHTQTDGSDLNAYLDKLFKVLNTPDKERKNLPKYLDAFPFANGGLFKEKHQAPVFTRGSRNAILNSGDQDWSAINPDIFGSMFQAVISADQRGGLGQHYTSVPNIMKVIEPLFLNDLYEEFEKAKKIKKIETKIKKLKALLNRLYKMKIFDPACGSGNFLIIAYKELRILEMKVFKEGEMLNVSSAMLNLSDIHLSQFYGIEIDDFAHEIAKLSLWLAEHQMNVEFFKVFGRTNPTLPLKEAGQIKQGNATRLDWEDVCPKNEGDEIYVLGNPPFLGESLQSADQKEDKEIVFAGIKDYKKQDYISCWFLKAAKYLEKNMHCAFVSTNSICQGIQVPMLWSPIFSLGIEISFAYRSFHWTNSAKAKAKVTCIIVGLRVGSDKRKAIYDNGIKNEVSGISAYLIESKNIIIYKRKNPISKIPVMMKGNGVYDDGNFMLDTSEKDELVSSNPKVSLFIKPVVGSSEFINNIQRWCIWIDEKNKEDALKIPEINERVQKVYTWRRTAGSTAQAYSDVPFRFKGINRPEKNLIIIPAVSSQRREYIPIGYLTSEYIVTDAALMILDPEPFVLGVISSSMHMCWVKTLAGRLKMDFRYSSGVCYNTFPFPPISTQLNNEITKCVFRILEEREKHPEKTLAQLYDPDNMTEGLREAHRLNDLAVEHCYRSRPFESDEERLECLFKLYEKMLTEEDQNTLFVKEKKTRKRKN
jgi:type I restriction-modification system DNA methylase subunit